MKNCCRNCHFLVKHHRRPIYERNDPDSAWYTDSWNADERASGHPPLNQEWTSACWRGIWDKRSHPRLQEELDKERGEECFFFEWREGLHVKVARELQRREYDNLHLKRGYRHTQIGLAIAAVGLVVSAVFQVLNFFWR